MWGGHAWGETPWAAERVAAGPTTHQGEVSFTGAATFAPAPSLQAAGAWSVTGAATFAAAGVRKAVGAWNVTGAATFAAAGARKAAGAIALQGAGIFAADGVVAGAGVVHQGATVLAGAATFQLDGVVVSAPAPSRGAPWADPRLAKFLQKPHRRRPLEPAYILEAWTPPVDTEPAPDEDWEAIVLALLD